MNQNTNADISRSAEYPVPPEVLWDAWTNPAIVARWFAPVVEIDLRPNGKLKLAWPEQGDVTEGTIEKVEPPRLLRFSWRSCSPETRELIDGNWKTTVEVRIEVTASGSRLELSEWFDQLPARYKRRGIADNERGWDLCLAALYSELSQRAPR